MAEQATQENAGNGTKGKKQPAEVTQVQMKDGRTVGFAGQRKLDKEYTIDESKLQVGDDGSVLIAPGAVKVRIDFRNGETVNFEPKGLQLATAAGHGYVQKLGDEAASEKDVDDAYIAISELAERLGKGEWTVAREGGGFSGASVVIKAIMEATGKSMEEVKAFLQKKLDDAKARGETLTRPALYAAFRNPNSKTGQIIKRLEDEKASKASAIDADAAIGELGGQAA